jgi:hypothetical protein
MLSIGTVNALPISFKENSRDAIPRVATTISCLLSTKPRDHCVSHIVD